MKLVVDSNVLISAILRAGQTRKLLLSSPFELFCPDHAQIEVENHQPELIEKAKVDEHIFRQIVELVFEPLTMIPFDEYVSFKKKA